MNINIENNPYNYDDLSLSRRLDFLSNTLEKQKQKNKYDSYEDFLVSQKILKNTQSFGEILLHISYELAKISQSFNKNIIVESLVNKFYTFLSDFSIVLSTPIYTNIARHNTSKPLSACSVPPIDFKMHKNKLMNLIKNYHVSGMGTGFNFDSAEDPCQFLLMFNQFALDEVSQGLIERPVGNMGILSINHPKIREFAKIKYKTKGKFEWKFNLSINLTEEFIYSLKQGKYFYLKDGTAVDPSELLDEISSYAHECGCPGLIFMHKHEEYNKTPHIGSYLSVAPCGEVPLVHGETCQFGYINLASMLNNNNIDYKKLKATVHCLVEILDNCVEQNISHSPTQKSAEVIASIRKIGVGICGFSDLLMELGISYESKEALQLAKNLLSFINFESKKASIELAKVRSPFGAFNDKETKVHLIIAPYIDKISQTVSKIEWKQLEKDMYTFGIRHSSTIILPPTGRSSLMAGISASIEPPFRLVDDFRTRSHFTKNALKFGYKGDLESIFSHIDQEGSVATLKIPKDLYKIYKTCLEIPSESHIQMVAAFQEFTDESISKTVNLPNNCSPKDIRDTYLKGYQLGLRGITIFRNGCLDYQPKRLQNTDA